MLLDDWRPYEGDPPPIKAAKQTETNSADLHFDPQQLSLSCFITVSSLAETLTSYYSGDNEECDNPTKKTGPAITHVRFIGAFSYTSAPRRIFSGPT